MDTRRLHDTISYIHAQPENVFLFIDLITGTSNFISIIQTLKRDTAYDTQLYILIDNDWRERGHSTTNIRRKYKKINYLVKYCSVPLLRSS